MTTYSYDRTIYESEGGDIHMALTGESLITRSVSKFREPNFLKLVDMIRGADVAFTHAEMLFHNYEDAPTYQTGTYMRCDPRNIAELQWMGFDMVSCACNHSIDFGEGGVMTNIRYLDQYGMPHAGTGRNIAEARAPVYIETPKGRVALLSATTSGLPHIRAGEARRDVVGRPGANLIRHTTEYVVDRATFDQLHEAAKALGWLRRGGDTPQETDTEFYLPGVPGVQAERPGFAKVALGETVQRHTTPNWDDLEGWLQRVRDARRMAQWVVCTMHSHEPGTTAAEPSDHAVTIMRACIDAGADVFVGHGPHQDRGIEIYKGKPIFYSLGDFFLQNDTVLLMPHDNLVRYGLGWEATPGEFYETRDVPRPLQPIGHQSAIAMTRWEKGEFKEARLYPVDLGFGKPRSERGRPALAEGDVAREILDRFQQRSAPFGTEIIREGNVGVIRA
ncbi:MAG: CapA family protein [Chloroflexi bacterium]|nr:CapA family protein [Chloroflexota bacterium]